MALTEKTFYQGQPAAAGTTLYTVPANKRVIITSVMLCNTSGGAKWCKVGRNGTADANLITSTAQIVSGKTEIIAPGLVLVATDTLQAAAETDNTVTVTVCGLERDV